MEHFGDYEWQVSDNKHHEGFHDANVMRESRQESPEKSEQYPDASRTEYDDEERSKSGENIDSLNVFDTDLTESFEHVV